MIFVFEMIRKSPYISVNRLAKYTRHQRMSDSIGGVFMGKVLGYAVIAIVALVLFFYFAVLITAWI